MLFLLSESPLQFLLGNIQMKHLAEIGITDLMALGIGESDILLCFPPHNLPAVFMLQHFAEVLPAAGMGQTFLHRDCQIFHIRFLRVAYDLVVGILVPG